ncbi:MAG: type II restriction endonuclease [Desulfurivibrionaceae bacterium]
MAWMEREEILFRTMEKHLIGERLSQGFDGDVDSFISFSLSVQNRRKSRRRVRDVVEFVNLPTISPLFTPAMALY